MKTDLRVNKSRPMEALIGSNRGIVRVRLGTIHCGSPIKTQLRHARPKGLRSAPVALRRGWLACCLETIAENRDLFDYVAKG